jgi:hypothetical protein
MDRFYFDVRNNGTSVLDEVGLELDDLKTAAGEAASALAEKVEEMVEGSLRQELVTEIRYLSAAPVLRVTLGLELIGNIVPLAKH